MSYPSELFQALGWATLSSFWQMGLLWAAFSGINAVLNPAAHHRYRLAVGFLLTGFILFIYTGWNAATSGLPLEGGAAPAWLLDRGNWLQQLLEAASFTYLLLLVVPSVQLYRNWQALRRLKRSGLQKADLAYRLFTEKTRKLLGIKRPVGVFFSNMVYSPLTVGYLKPVILLPLSGFTGLSPAQAEAVLLHELSHIRRMDYLVNLLLATVHTLLYFNPFVHYFLRQAGAERELSCDRLVLQFGYDPLSYASALLSLERHAQAPVLLAMPSSGKSYLRFRVEQIVGQNTPRPKAARQPLSLLLGGFFLLILNGLIFSNARREVMPAGGDDLISFTPGLFVEPEQRRLPSRSLLLPTLVRKGDRSANTPIDREAHSPVAETETFSGPEFTDPALIYAAATGASLRTAVEKAMVVDVVEGTKNILKAQWPQVKLQLGEVLTESEMQMARADYMAEVEAVNWEALEGGLLERYEVLDWNGIYSGLAEAKMALQLDSMERRYQQMLAIIQGAEAGSDSTSLLPFPDQSRSKLDEYKFIIRGRIDSIRALRRPVIKL